MRFYARKLKIKRVKRDIVREFLNNNHTQGYANYNIAYGLYDGDELIMLMTFGKPRFNKSYQWEIIRECTKRDCIVAGGTSKIWDHFVSENSVSSCICYSYPHNGEFTEHYINHCGFKNIEKSRPKRKIYFEGVWNGSLKRIDKSILERHGVDRLLKGSFGQDRTNEQILLDLGFERKEEDGWSPQIDSYFPFGVVYRIDDLDDGKFYIGKCSVRKKWENGYMGSGTKWQNHLKKHPDITLDPTNAMAHRYKRTILKDNFKSPKEVYDYESREIKRYCTEIDGVYHVTDNSCMNLHVESQNSANICEECGGYYSHKKTCSKYKPILPCPECGGRSNKHKKTCSKYKELLCPECGSRGVRHRKSCSHYTSSKGCPECGSLTTHKKSCSHHKEPSQCLECKGKSGHHKKTCSKYKEQKICLECGSPLSSHKKTCSKYNKRAACPECGNLLNSHIHKKWCSHYKQKEPCPECGSIGISHKKTCSKYKKVIKCEECGATNHLHKKTCSHYKDPGRCPECGYSLRSNCHAKTCSHYIERNRSKAI